MQKITNAIQERIKKQHGQVRRSARNKRTKIAQDSGSISRRHEGSIAGLCDPRDNAESGPEDKQDGMIISGRVPYLNADDGEQIGFQLDAVNA